MRSRISKALDYTPPGIAFIAALVAIVGAPKWNDTAIGLSKITPLGWVVFVIGFAALLCSLLVTKRNHISQASQQAVREAISRIGQDQLLRGIDRLTGVFRQSRLWDEERPPPISSLEFLEPERRSALASINLNSPSPYFDGKLHPKWWQMFEDTAKRASEQLTAALQIYVTFFTPEVVEATTKLLNCDFMHRLHYMHTIIDANTMDSPNRPVTFFWVAPDEHHECGYSEFWNLIAQATEVCTPARSRLKDGLLRALSSSVLEAREILAPKP